MDLNMDVYMTTKRDSLPDLRTFTNEEGFYKWKSQVKEVAFHTESFKEISDKILIEAKKYPILDAFAVIEYPMGQVFAADDEVGERLRDIFKKKRIPFHWNITRDEEAPPDSFKVSLEIVCEKEE